ncbi:MAG TPA: fibronectin type III domain-containing protein [Gaiellaceae bacterium]|nr:fibronectin type III domain-containing protein [Gaiellaceae bacterium]
MLDAGDPAYRASSLIPLAAPTQAAGEGAIYEAEALVRSRRGALVCLQLRELEGTRPRGVRTACAIAGSDWRPLRLLRYTTVAAASTIVADAYEWDATARLDFEVASFALRRAAAFVPPLDHAHVRLAWEPVEDAVRYDVHRGPSGEKIFSTAGLSYTDRLLWPSTSYAYAVRAVDRAGGALAEELFRTTTQALPESGFPRAFAATSFWNTPIEATPRYAWPQDRERALLRWFVDRATDDPADPNDFAPSAPPNLVLGAWSVAVAEAAASDPPYHVECEGYRDAGAPCTLGDADGSGSLRIPANAVPDPSGDAHLAVYDPEAKREWDLYDAICRVAGADCKRVWREGRSWSAKGGARIDLSGDGVVRPGRSASGNAANLALLGGLIRPEEILQGRIEHALVFSLPGIGEGPPVCPATHNAPVGGGLGVTDALREGHRLRLDPSVDVDALPLPAWQRTIARALQRYGMYLRDNGGTMGIYAENTINRGYDPWRDELGLPGLSVPLAGIPWSQFRVLDDPTCG